MTFFRLLVPVAVLVMSAVFLVETISFRQMGNLDPGGPKLLPRLLIAVVAVCALVELVRFIRTTSLAEMRTSLGDTFQWITPHSATARFNSAQRAIIAVTLSLIYPMAIVRIGFILSTIAFITLLALVFRARPWAALLVGVVTALLFFFLFAEVLNVRVPRGEWFDIRSVLFG